jgi:predicted deacylase
MIKDWLEGSDAPARTSGVVPVGTMSSGMQIGLPFIAVRGARKGKTLWLHGQVHGDEVNGVVAAVRFARGIDPAALSGNIVVTPTVNPHGLDHRSKRNPFDGIDLDQIFPGNPRGLISERLAHALMGEVKAAADVLVNLHTMTPLFDSKPYCVYKLYPDSGITEQQMLRAMAPFFPHVACRVEVGSKTELPGDMSGALDYQCLKAGILAFMLELGGGSRLEPEHVAVAERGFRGLAQQMGILTAPQAAGATSLTRVTKRSWIFADAGGLFVADCRTADRLAAGAVVGTTTSLQGEVVERLAVDRPGVVIGIRNDPIVHTGDRMAFIAHEWDEVTVSP